jgi:phospholipid/cholesterol/gamma-HCH transport system substrate-binding protein
VNEERTERRLKLRVGIFVLVAVLAFLGMIYALGARARLFEARYTLHAEFTEVGGLADGATVRLAGVQIGRVSAVNLPPRPGGKVRVDLTIARQFSDRIRRDSIARIETQGLLGDRIIEITVGSASAAAVAAGETIPSRDPTDIAHVIDASAATVRNVAALADSLRQTAEALNQSNLVEEAASTVKDARKLTTDLGPQVAAAVADARKLTADIGREFAATASTARTVTERAGRLIDQVEHGPGLAHTLLYEEPVALRKLDDVVASIQGTLDRVQRGEGAVGVLTSADSTAAARRLVAAMDRIGRLGDHPESEGLVPGLLFDPKYRVVLDDLRDVTRNFREVSERLVGGRGALGGLLRDEPAGELGQAVRDLQLAMANLREITERINEGQGTLGALIADPTVYERLVNILDGTQRSFLLRNLLRGLGRDGDARSRDPGADKR